jgi:arsenite oxidase small subunit
MAECDKLAESGRRFFLSRGAVAAVGAAAVAGAIPTSEAEAAPAPARITYPVARLANVNELRVCRHLGDSGTGGRCDS